MKIFKNKAGFEFVILSQENKNVTIQFLESGSIRVANSSNVYSGKVKDMYAKTRYGIGYMGDYEKTPFHKQAMQLWSNMMKRCYSDSDPRGYKSKGTYVEPRWHCFADFLRDIQKLKNFDMWLAGEGLQLDKDLLIPEANCYGPHTCSFVTEAENKAAGKKGKVLVDGEWLTPAH